MDAPRIIFGLVKKSLISRDLWPPRPLMPSKVDLAVLPGPDPREAQDKKTLTQKACLPAFKYILIYIYIYIYIDIYVLIYIYCICPYYIYIYYTYIYIYTLYIYIYMY